jgi:hypothetical protein
MFTLSEPTTTLTDYVMAIQCIIQAVALHKGAARMSGGPRPVVQWYVVGFVIAALASFAGGTSHGFRFQLGAYWSPVWSLTVYSIVTAFVIIIAAGIRSTLQPQVIDEATRRSGRRWLVVGFGLTALGLVALVAKVSFHQHFNHNDLYHVIQWGGLYGVYRGGRTLHGL